METNNTTINYLPVEPPNGGVLVSVMLPTYNRAKLVGRAIRSILNQTFTAFELIIIDDGSTDMTKEVIESFHDERIRIIRHEQNKGLMAARNTGLRNAKGAYLAFQDSDDWWHPKKLAEEIILLKSAPPSVGAVYSQIEKRYRDGRVLLFPSTPPSSGDLLLSFLKGEYLVTLQAVLMRKSCIEMVGTFDETFSVFGDAEFIIRFAAHYQFLYNPHVRAYLEVQPDSVSRKKEERLHAREHILKQHHDVFRRYPQALKRWRYRLARAFLARGKIKKFFHYFILSFCAR